jgi:hypothetical protein
MFSMRSWAAVLAAAAMWGFHPSGAASQERSEPAPWPAADELFQQDARWAGGDGVWSVRVGEASILWLFADSFVRRSEGQDRGGAAMIRNSIARQEGLAPESSRLRFFWKEEADGPVSYFAEQDDTWFWPGAAVHLDSLVLVFLMQIRANEDSASEIFGFEVFDWQAIAIRNVSLGPTAWSEHRVATASNPFQIILGSGGAIRVGEHLYAFGAQEPGGKHPVFLARWTLDQVREFDLSAPEWWCGDSLGWVLQSRLEAAPAVLFRDAQTEFTVHWDAQLERFVQTQSLGFGGTDLAFRFAERVEGPWSVPVVFYRPAESERTNRLVYAGKAHPEWSADGLVVSYVANAWDFADLITDQTIYYPRFIRVPAQAIAQTLERSRQASDIGGMPH